MLPLSTSRGPLIPSLTSRWIGLSKYSQPLPYQRAPSGTKGGGRHPDRSERGGVGADTDAKRGEAGLPPLTLTLQLGD